MTASVDVPGYRLRALLDRARAFQQIVVDLSVGLPDSSPGMRRALTLFVDYVDALRAEVSAEFAATADDTIRLANLRTWNTHLKARVGFFDELFRRGDRRIPSSLVDLIDSEIQRMGGQPTHAVVTVGRPDNFMTFTRDLRAALFAGLPAAPTGTTAPLALITAPEAEGARLSWLPITCGHELAHYLQRVRPVTRSHSNDLDPAAVAAITDPPPGAGSQPVTRVFEQIAANWLEELTCDAYAVHRFGAAGVAALTDFLAYVSPVSTAGSTHPPRALRTALMLRWLRGTAGGDDLGIVEGLDDLAVQTPALPEWARLLADHFTTLGDSIWSDVSTWCDTTPYTQADHGDRIKVCARLLRDGVPPVHDPAGEASDRFAVADLVNAVWLVFVEAADTRVNRLALKALDLLDFLQRWQDASGDMISPTKTPAASPIAAEVGALSASQIRRRLEATDDSRLILVPRLPPKISDPSIDLRLGNQFIVFEKSNTGQFDALNTSQDPRTIQTRIEKSWGDVFYLHPHQLVLAATLEYLVMPPDVAGQVITRSSYGRLGLLSATAVQVHPRFTGCLTLELVNLGEVPMAITPGERVAQLMLWHTSPEETVEDKDDQSKYRHPTGPEFSKIREDKESQTLVNLRQRFSNARLT